MMAAQSIELSCDQKFRAMQALSFNAHLTMDAAGRWYVAMGVSQRTAAGAPTQVGVSERGDTPEAAIIAQWAKLTQASVINPLILHRDGKDRSYIWDVCMWKEVDAS
jgi:hypothetical protein